MNQETCRTTEIRQKLKEYHHVTIVGNLRVLESKVSVELRIDSFESTTTQHAIAARFVTAHMQSSIDGGGIV